MILQELGNRGGLLVYAIPVLIGFIILFYTVVHIVRRASRRKSDGAVAISFTDLDQMKRTGLLSDEEQVAVRQSIARQWTERDEADSTTPASLEIAAAMAEAEIREQVANKSAPPVSTESDQASDSLSELVRDGRMAPEEAQRLQNMLAKRAAKRPKPPEREKG